MFKKIFYLIMLFSATNFVSSQTNLVPNPSFETIVVCPSTWSAYGNISDCANWLNFGNSPDYFHACGTNLLNVPNAAGGYQYARSGIAMAGLVTWYNPVGSSGPNYREYIATQLTNTLQIGIKYYISFFINYSGWQYGNRQVASNKIGMRFSTVASSSTIVAPINNFAHLKTNQIYQDTVNWLKISGSFIADSTYKYVCLGNFFNTANTDTASYPGPVFSTMSAYYYIDDVCVSTDSVYTQTWTNIFSNEDQIKEFKIFPNPTQNLVHINLNIEFMGGNIQIFDAIGKKIQTQPIKNTTEKINLNLNSGIYFIKASTKDGVSKTEKLVIE